MMKPTRRDYFEKFMAMFAGPVLQVTAEDAEAIHGELRWASEPEYCEDARWDQTAEGLPSLACYQLMSLIAEKKLLDIDRISVPRAELQSIFREYAGLPVDVGDFEFALEHLKGIEVLRIEDGQQFDSFFVHE